MKTAGTIAGILFDISAVLAMFSLIMMGIHVPSAPYFDQLKEGNLNVLPMVLSVATLPNLTLVSILATYLGECLSHAVDGEATWDRLTMLRNSVLVGVSAFLTQAVLSVAHHDLLVNPSQENYVGLLILIFSGSFGTGARTAIKDVVVKMMRRGG